MSAFRCIASCALCVLAVLVAFESHAGVILEHSVIGGGGGEPGNGMKSVFATAGQTVTGVLSGNCYINEIGFWYQPGCLLSGMDDLQGVVPTVYWLGGGHPNPFISATTLEFSIPRRSHVTINLYDVGGRLVKALVDEEVAPGRHRVILEGAGLSCGVYFCRMDTAEHVQTRKLVVLK
jgi:hypothetical protein